MVLLQDILDLADTHLCNVSSAVVCRKLSSIGRRVLSIESFSAYQGHCTTVHHCVSIFLEVALFSPKSICYICIFTDGPEASWEARWQHPKPNLDYNPKDCADNFVTANGLSRQQVHDRQKELWFIIKYERLNTQHMYVCFLLAVFISS